MATRLFPPTFKASIASCDQSANEIALARSDILIYQNAIDTEHCQVVMFPSTMAIGSTMATGATLFISVALHSLSKFHWNWAGAMTAHYGY